MAAKVIESTDAIPITSLVTVIYGSPSSGKSSLAQTAEDPITLDFDTGAHRAYKRKRVIQFDTWKDVNSVEEQIKKHKTIVLDTVGRALDLIADGIILNDPKMGTRAGGLTKQGWGTLKSQFAFWVKSMKTLGKDLIFIAHEKEDKDGEDRYFRPDIQGGSYTEVFKLADLMGYSFIDRQGRRAINFAPSDRSIGKDAGQLGIVEMGQYKDTKIRFFDEHPTFMADLLAQAKKNISANEEGDKAKAEIDEYLGSWETFAKDLKHGDAETFQGWIEDAKPELKSFPEKKRIAIWTGLQQVASKAGLIFDKATNTFVKKAGAA